MFASPVPQKYFPIVYSTITTVQTKRHRVSLNRNDECPTLEQIGAAIESMVLVENRTSSVFTT